MYKITLKRKSCGVEVGGWGDACTKQYRIIVGIYIQNSVVLLQRKKEKNRGKNSSTQWCFLLQPLLFSYVMHDKSYQMHSYPWPHQHCCHPTDNADWFGVSALMIEVHKNGGQCNKQRTATASSSPAGNLCASDLAARSIS